MHPSLSLDTSKALDSSVATKVGAVGPSLLGARLNAIELKHFAAYTRWSQFQFDFAEFDVPAAN